MAAVKQLIVRNPSRGRKREVEAVESGGFLAEARPVAGGYRPRFGTSDLVNIAIALRGEGYRIVAVGLADRNYRAVAEDEHAEDDLEAAVVAALQDADDDRVYEVLESGLYGLHLATIGVVDRDGSRFEIGREGTMRVLRGLSEGHLLSSLSDYLTAHG